MLYFLHNSKYPYIKCQDRNPKSPKEVARSVKFTAYTVMIIFSLIVNLQFVANVGMVVYIWYIFDGEASLVGL